MANKYEDSAGLNVNNHYGPRELGGTQGVAKTEGTKNEYYYDFDNTSLNLEFPVTDGTAWASFYDDSQSDATTFTIGGVDITVATEAAPVQIPDGNTGVISSGGTTGKVVITYKKYAS